MKVNWRDDRPGAVLVEGAEDLVGFLGHKDWCSEGDRASRPAWVVDFFERGEGQAVMHSRLVDAEADEAKSPARRQQLAQAAIAAVASGPPPVPDPAQPFETLQPESADLSLDDVDLAITSWDEARSRLEVAARRHDQWAGDAVVAALVEVLVCTRSLDERFGALWRRLPEEVRKGASARAADRLRRALRSYERPPDRKAFRDLREYERAGQPFDDWATAAVGFGSAIPREDLQGFRWLGGKLLHRGPRRVVELRSWRAGAEPRWKWRHAADINPRTPDREIDDRATYDQCLAGRDVLGTLELITSLIEAHYMFIGLTQKAQAGRGADNSKSPAREGVPQGSK